MKGGLVLSVSSRALLQACENLGVDSDALLAAAGLERAQVFDVDGRLPGEKVAALWREAHRRAGDPHLSLHAVEALPRGAYKVIDFLAASSPTVGEGLRRISRYFPLINNAVELPIEVGPTRATLGLAALGAVPRPYAEYCMAAVVLRSRLAFDLDMPLERVDFAYRPPPAIAEHERIFGCPVHFDAPATRLCLAREVWDSPVSTHDGALSEVLEQHATMLLERLPKDSTTAAQVRAAIRAELCGGDASLDHVASVLGMSGRTLQRRLRDEGLTYATVLDQTRASVAQAYLHQPDMSLAEVSYLLGFGDQSAFSRAFKRWTGSTPSAFRANPH